MGRNRVEIQSTLWACLPISLSKCSQYGIPRTKQDPKTEAVDKLGIKLFPTILHSVIGDLIDSICSRDEKRE